MGHMIMIARITPEMVAGDVLRIHKYISGNRIDDAGTTLPIIGTSGETVELRDIRPGVGIVLNGIGVNLRRLEVPK